MATLADSIGLRLARWWIRLVVRFDTEPDAGDATRIRADQPVCYALHIRQFSALLVLDEATRRLGLPRALRPLRVGAHAERSAFFFLTRGGQPSPLRRNPYRYSQRLERLIDAVGADPATELTVVPVSIFWGRAPINQDSVIKALFADAWVVPGFFRQTLRLLLHGRQTRVHFGAPISMRELVDHAHGDTGHGGAAVRRMARLLRVTFRRERERVVGPNLSHRQTVVNAMIDSDAVRAAIATEAADPKQSPERAELRARGMAMEIAADYSYPFIRAYELLLDRLWNKLYEGVELHHFDTLTRAAAGVELVYLPCHRSHVDYLLLSWLIHGRGLMPPHIAAGDNLNLPVVGSLLRRGGAFFLRRSFKGDALYGAVFREYLHTVLSRGFPIEYFIEGGRSRSGRMLWPRSGMLAMTVGSHLRDPTRPILFVPVWIGYERVVEAESYVAELAGRPKQRETLWSLRHLPRALRGRFGKVHVNIGEPVALDTFLDQHWPFWRARAHDAADQPPSATDGDAMPPAGRRATDLLAQTLATRINDALVINPVNLLALAMHDTPRHAMDASQLARLMDLLRALPDEVPHSARQVITPMDGARVIDYALGQGLARRIEHPLGDIVEVDARHAPLLPWFAANVLHAFILPGLLATVIARNPRVEPLRLAAIARNLLPFLRSEWFLSGDEEMLLERLQRLIEAFVRHGLARSTGAFLTAPADAQPEAMMLERLARLARQPIERYYIAVTTLVRIGPGRLTARTLEDSCHLLAQRVSYLHDAGGASFADRTSFRAIVRSLIELGQVEERDGHLHATAALPDVADDALFLLAAGTRQALGQITQLSADEAERATRALGGAR